MNEVSPVDSHIIHIPVMLPEVINALQVAQAGVFLDATFGGGGHSKIILEANPANEVWAIDRDPEAETRANALKKTYPDRFHFHRMKFSEIQTLPELLYDGALFDLGVSSFQLDDPQRGFSFRHSSTLDMRMDSSSGQSAETFLNTASHEELVQAIRDFGEERHWKRIVNAILSHRGTQETKRSDLFVELIVSCYPLRERFRKIHPATKTFQGIRIAVNQELLELQEALPKIFTRLKSHGRLAVISFHSLEDRIVKQFFREKAGSAKSKTISPQVACTEAIIISKKIISPSKTEISRNPRSRSAKLRVLEKL
jgi:16S rRNA (cytosine1402-N4)-methyltransferase